jgi:hypothetical protein
MLKLVKQTSYENYPITPQTSAVRKLTIKGTASGVVDMNKSYLLVKNSLATTVNGVSVPRNVGFGCAFSQDQIWEYPSSCQIRSASLKIGGQQVEYVEDVNIRVVNQAIYEKNHEQIRREANVGGYTFQRLETGSKSASPANPAVAVRSQGLQMSAFLDETIEAPAGANTYAKTGAGYKIVSCSIPLRELFKFCDSPQAADLFVGGTTTQEIVVELQFEDRNQLLCEYVNLAADVTSTVGTPRPKQFETLAITPASVANLGGAQPPTVQATLAASIYQANTVASYSHVTQVPLYVGQPICLWLAGALPGVVGSNYSIVQSVSVPVGGGVATVVFKPYTLDNVNFVRTAGNPITPAQYFANVYAGGAGVLTAISGVPDPVLAINPAGDTTYTAIDAGLNTRYSIEGLEMVMVEKPMAKGQKQTINYIQYMRDTDTIPTGQLTYAKSFQIDPNCSGLFAVFPPKRTGGSAQTNMLSLSHHAGVTEGLSYRNMIDNQQLYSRDIAFSSATEAVEPLYLERLNLTAMQLGMSLKNLSPVAHMMAKNGVTAHAMISEPVEMKQMPQQLNLRMTFNVNASDRTIYVYKAIMSQITV